MKVVIATDSFKGSLTSLQAGEAIQQGVLAVYPQAQVIVNAIGDGGEGTAKALIAALKAKKQEVLVTGPLGQQIKSQYGIVEKTAIIEMASVAGITLLERHQLNPLVTTTYGVGEIILDAFNRGCRRFLLAIGGSATNDGGIGMLQALGFGCFDAFHRQVSQGAQGLKQLKVIEAQAVPTELLNCEFLVACDVTNPLCGQQGASAVFARQKGADDAMIAVMDQWLFNYSQLAKNVNPQADASYPGCGAAGGLGFALATFLNAQLISGIDLVLKEINFAAQLKDADLVITGEGCLDGQSAMGKAPLGVAKLAKAYHCPVIAFAGKVTNTASKCNVAGIDAYFSIINETMTLEEAMQESVAWANLTKTVEQVLRLWQLRD